MTSEYPCPACGYLAFDEPIGSYAICGVCGWEDDPVQLRYPLDGGGANTESLQQFQYRVDSMLSADPDAASGYTRDPDWCMVVAHSHCRYDDERRLRAVYIYYWRPESD